MIKFTLSASSASRFTANLHRKQREIIHAGKEATYDAANIVLKDSQNRVPSQTGALRESGHVTEKHEAHKGISVVSYGNSNVNSDTGKATADYAVPVEQEHKFLENALLDNVDSVKEILRDRLSQSF